MSDFDIYREDIAKIAAHGLGSADGFADVATFVIATIGVRFSTVGKRLAAVRARDWPRVRNAGLTRGAVEYVAANRHDLHTRVSQCRTAADAVEILIEVPGLDTIKAGFVAQCLGFDVGCLDTHNLRRFSLSADAFKASHLKTREKRREKIAHYVDVCARLGGSTYLWASWCELIAAKYGRHFSSGANVSIAHVRHCNAM